MGSQLSEEDKSKTASNGSDMCLFCAARRERNASFGESRRQSQDGRYVGSYAALVGFLREVKAKGSDPLPEERFRALMAAVEDLSSQGVGQSVSPEQALFDDHISKEQFSTVLPALGISILADGELNFRPSKSMVGSDSTSQSTQDCSEEEEIAVLNMIEFDQRTRGDIRSDVQLAIYAFGYPLDLVSRYSIDVGVLGAWITAIAEAYKFDNSYHNWRHGFDVFQFSYMAINAGQSSKFFNFQDILAMYSAHLAHDVAHTGTNNGFLVKTGHPLALTYNDVSVLESMHASVFFTTLRQPGNNFLSGLSDHDFSVFRPKVIDSILATDMSKHFDLVDRFSARVSKEGDNPFTIDTKNDRERQKASKGDRRMLMQAFTHMADLGHCLRPWEIHKNLVVALEREFFAQGDKELELGIPVMPMMNRYKDSAAASQEFFLDKLVRPLAEPFKYFLIPAVGDVLLENLASNKRRWMELVEKHGKLTAGAIVPLDDEEDED